MDTRHPHLRPLRRFSPTIAILGTAALLSGLAASTSVASTSVVPQPAYGWPVKPFHRQHPVRSNLGDPRIGPNSRSFHFGVDVSCPDGTPVYATITGRAYISARHRQTVSVIADRGDVEFGYWHIVPTVRSGERVTAYRTVIGKVARGWEHVHFAEHRNGVYLNPLRPGAMGPYRDTTVPTVRVLTARTPAPTSGRPAHGRVDLVAEVSDVTPIAIAGPWHGKPVTPALIEWRLLRGHRAVTPWRTAVDFRFTYPSNDLFSRTYASWTLQNKKFRDGRYAFYLVHGLDTRTLSDGTYLVQVRATDIRGNTGHGSFPLAVANNL